ncbi:hypothetical protein [Saccharopolyspora mangrovi]|uniref:Uncharacterized protein n=1 Tax=Saccharopolyspora mangrovi TaxID=3082379 RepID=A0ABU6AF37_9PSEU|nr:hypothetical protein [Saccharopolyspora sp. S2-29]MEB3370144.1 hypothetical protein [Saccharopolyspora sp. S2-29]
MGLVDTAASRASVLPVASMHRGRTVHHTAGNVEQPLIMVDGMSCAVDLNTGAGTTQW